MVLSSSTYIETKELKMQNDNDIIVGFIVLGTVAAIIIVMGIAIGVLLG